MSGDGCVKYELWRQDDNGNRFTVATFPDRAVAEKLLAELSRNTHKQIYWIAETKEEMQDGE